MKCFYVSSYNTFGCFVICTLVTLVESFPLSLKIHENMWLDASGVIILFKTEIHNF